MLYDFKTDDGQTVKLDFAVGSAPTIGTTVVIDGVSYRRVPASATLPSVVQYPEHGSSSLPPVPGLDTDKRGKVVIRSKRDELRACAYTGAKRY